MKTPNHSALMSIWILKTRRHLTLFLKHSQLSKSPRVSSEDNVSVILLSIITFFSLALFGITSITQLMMMESIDPLLTADELTLANSFCGYCSHSNEGCHHSSTQKRGLVVKESYSCNRWQYDWCVLVSVPVGMPPPSACIEKRSRLKPRWWCHSKYISQCIEEQRSYELQD